MAEQFDVTARLAEGRPTVDDVEEYVAASRRLGYQHRDLTAHPTQVRDWYDGDDGMNLRVLDADHRALSAAALAAEEAVRVQADLVAQLSSAWAGRGAGAADEFLCRSSQAAQSVGTAVRRAADSAAALRDALWRAVDAKVAATEAVAARQAPHRVEWLAAARTLTNGGADVDAASELVHQRVMPFVDLDVGSDWVGAMHAAAASIDAAYDAAVGALGAAPRAVFEVPGDLGPAPEPSVPRLPVPAGPPDDVGPAPEPPVHVGRPGDVGLTPEPPMPASPPDHVRLVSTAPVPQDIPAAAVAPAASIPAAADAPAAWSPGLAAVPAAPVAPLADAPLGTGALGSGLPGFGQQLADLLRGLIGSAGGGSPEDLAFDHDPVDDEPKDADDEDEDEDEDDPDGEDADKDADEDDGEEDAAEPDPGEKPTADCTEGDPPATAPRDAAPQPDSEAPPQPPPPAVPAPEPVPPAVPTDGEPTPCEKAADAVPQVGE